jgi:hypothetical protein
MAAHAWTDDELRQFIEQVEQHGGVSAASRALGIPRETLQARFRAAQTKFGAAPPLPRRRDDPYPEPAFTIDPLPEEDHDIAELIARRRVAFANKQRWKEARKLVPVDVKIDGPVGILHMGDPHVDDDGCDWERLESDVDLVQSTPGLLAGNIGDITNCWVGRLARLYAQQSTTAKQAWKLAEWFVGVVPWLYLVAGNHDVWAGDGDPIQWMARQAGAVYEPHGVRLGLNLPNGRQIRVNCRHDFVGHSQWNPAHGVGKAAMLGPSDHIFVSGHRHVFGLGWHKRTDGVWSCALRVGTYKVYDGYADAKGFPEHNIPSVCTLIFPDATSEEGLVEVIKDPVAAADYLTWARYRFNQGKTVQCEKLQSSKAAANPQKSTPSKSGLKPSSPSSARVRSSRSKLSGKKKTPAPTSRATRP